MNAWANGLVSCLGCNGVVLVSSQSLLNQVVDTLGKVRNPPHFVVCSEETQPSYPQACVVSDMVLRTVDMNVIFPTERPIMIIDDSLNWSISWEWLSYLPTFHMSCEFSGGAVTNRFLHGASRWSDHPVVEASRRIQRGLCAQIVPCFLTNTIRS